MPEISKSIRYSIIIPAYQEADIIGASLEKLAAYLTEKNHAHDTEVIVVSADSRDKTAQIAESYSKLFKHFELVQPGKRVGKGRDVRAGILAAKGDYVLFTDADLATPAHHIFEAFRLLEQGNDIVIGIRNLWQIHSGFRAFVSIGSNILTRTLILPTIADTQCGFKAFTRDAAARIFDRLTILGWGFDMEVLMIAKQHRLRVAQLPIPDWHDPKAAKGRVGADSAVGAAFKTLHELARIRAQAWKGMYR